MESCLGKLAIFGALISISVGSFAYPDIAGKWQCKGYDPFMQRNYTTTGDIQKNGDNYKLSNWKDAEISGVTFSGNGMQYEKLENSFAIVMWADFDPSIIEFGLSKVLSANKMVGRWTIKNAPIAPDYTCKKIG